MIDFIDIGCGTGGSIEWAKTKFGGSTHLGIDNREKEVKEATKNGYNVTLADITSEDVVLPQCRYITMLHVLEHLKNEEDVEKVIKKAVNAASEFVIIRSPSFDSIEYLQLLGFRLTWTNWIGHPTAVTTDMLKMITDKLGFKAETGHLMPVLNSVSNEIVPISSPVDTIVYDPSVLEAKKFVEFVDVYREVYYIINIGTSFLKQIKESLNNSSSEYYLAPKTTYLSAEYYIDLIKNNIPFSFARYGDGELIIMFNYKSVIGRDIGDMIKSIEPMKQIFRNHYDYFHCKLNCTFHTHSLKCFGVDIDEVCKFMIETCPDMPFYDGEIWQGLSFSGKIEQLTRELNLYTPVFIGGKHLSNIQYLNGITNMELITVHDRKAWDDFENIKQQIRQKIESGRRMFCFSMGYAGKIMIDELYSETRGKCFMIDFGSLWDPYCGVLSRNGMRNVGFQKFQSFTKYKLPLSVSLEDYFSRT
jgi:hypothetical protein